MELIIFAKKNTNEKALVPCPRERSRDVMLMLKEKHGGDWLMVDSLKGSGEYITYTDDLIYQGFHPSIDRYSTSINTL